MKAWGWGGGVGGAVYVNARVTGRPRQKQDVVGEGPGVMTAGGEEGMASRQRVGVFD